MDNSVNRVGGGPWTQNFYDSNATDFGNVRTLPLNLDEVSPMGFTMGVGQTYSWQVFQQPQRVAGEADNYVPFSLSWFASSRLGNVYSQNNPGQRTFKAQDYQLGGSVDTGRFSIWDFASFIGRGLEGRSTVNLRAGYDEKVWRVDITTSTASITLKNPGGAKFISRLSGTLASNVSWHGGDLYNIWTSYGSAPNSNLWIRGEAVSGTLPFTVLGGPANVTLSVKRALNDKQQSVGVKSSKEAWRIGLSGNVESVNGTTLVEFYNVPSFTPGYLYSRRTDFDLFLGGDVWRSSDPNTGDNVTVNLGMGSSQVMRWIDEGYYFPVSRYLGGGQIHWGPIMLAATITARYKKWNIFGHFEGIIKPRKKENGGVKETHSWTPGATTPTTWPGISVPASTGADYVTKTATYIIPTQSDIDGNVAFEIHANAVKYMERTIAEGSYAPTGWNTTDEVPGGSGVLYIKSMVFRDTVHDQVFVLNRSGNVEWAASGVGSPVSAPDLTGAGFYLGGTGIRKVLPDAMRAGRKSGYSVDVEYGLRTSSDAIDKEALIQLNPDKTVFWDPDWDLGTSWAHCAWKAKNNWQLWPAHNWPNPGTYRNTQPWETTSPNIVMDLMHLNKYVVSLKKLAPINIYFTPSVETIATTSQ